MTEDDMQAGWDAAIDICLNGDDDCTYGGMTPATGYWLCSDDCSSSHTGSCAWCPAAAATWFAGWGDDGWSLWQVPACEEHGAAWAAEHPEWSRDAEPTPRKTTAELLAEMDPITRAVAEEYNRAMEEALIGGVEPGGGLFQFDGVLAALGMNNGALPAVVAPSPKAPPPRPPRMRFNQDTKTWEAQ